MAEITRALIDTSVLLDDAKHLGFDWMPEESYISVITVAELQASVHSAENALDRSRRIATLNGIAHIEPLTVTALAANLWATFQSLLHERDLASDSNDLWIVAIAAAHDLPVITRDEAFDVFGTIGGPTIVRI